MLNQEIEEIENTLIYEISSKKLIKKKFDLKDLKKLEKKDNNLSIKKLFQNSYNPIILENSLILKKYFMEFKSFPNLIKSLVGKNYFDFFSFYFVSDEKINLFEFNKNYKIDNVDNKNYFYLKYIIDFLGFLKKLKNSKKIIQKDLEIFFLYENLIIQENDLFFEFFKEFLKNINFEKRIFIKNDDLKKMFLFDLSDSQILLLLKIFEENLLWNLETVELYLFYNNLKNQLLKKKNIIKFLTPLNSEFFKSTYYFQKSSNLIFDLKTQIDIFEKLKQKEPLNYIKKQKNILRKKKLENLSYLTLLFYESKFLLLIKNSENEKLKNELKKKDFINYSKKLENYKQYKKYKNNYVK